MKRIKKLQRNHSYHPSILIFFLWVTIQFLLLQQVIHASWVVDVPAEQEECFTLRAPHHSMISGTYDVLDDHLPADQVTVIIYEFNAGDEDNNKKEKDGRQRHSSKMIYRSPFGKRTASFSMDMTDELNRIQICIQNALVRKPRRRFDKESRSVGIEIRVEPPNADQFDEKTQELQTYANKANTAMMDLLDHISNRKHRERQHRKLVELIFSELLGWTLAESAFVIALACGQVWYLQRTVSRMVM